MDILKLLIEKVKIQMVKGDGMLMAVLVFKVYVFVFVILYVKIFGKTLIKLIAIQQYVNGK